MNATIIFRSDQISCNNGSDRGYLSWNLARSATDELWISSSCASILHVISCVCNALLSTCARLHYSFVRFKYNSYITSTRDVKSRRPRARSGYIPSRRGITVLCHRLLGKWRQTRLLLSVTSANVFCWLLNSNRASCCGWICCVIYSLPGRSAFRTLST